MEHQLTLCPNMIMNNNGTLLPDMRASCIHRKFVNKGCCR